MQCMQLAAQRPSSVNDIYFSKSGIYNSYFVSAPEIDIKYNLDSIIIYETMLKDRPEYGIKTGHFLYYHESESSNSIIIPHEVLQQFGIKNKNLTIAEGADSSVTKFNVLDSDYIGELVVKDYFVLTTYSFGLREKADSMMIKYSSILFSPLEFHIDFIFENDAPESWFLIIEGDTLVYSEQSVTYTDYTIGVYNLIFKAIDCRPKEIIIDTREILLGGGNTTYELHIDVRLDVAPESTHPLIPIGRFYYDLKHDNMIFEKL